ncbi:uncharacterized protein LOC125177901 [Hyalella azteca]|uniref:Uncharacterized protein LOC125177901 n=1 Tax=Hyalella azteca TaxID=294128 RepID=A0A979FHN8_HYAAZ|nr:uncharacterized protein LOC125177901 [Hyalella azteca]
MSNASIIIFILVLLGLTHMVTLFLQRSSGQAAAFEDLVHQMKQKESKNRKGLSPSLQDVQEKIDILERRLARMSHAIEKLWCTTQDVMSNGGFCVTAERIYTGGNIIFEPEVRGIYTGASITFEAEVREIFTGASIIFETEVRGIYTGASITFEAEVREIFTGASIIFETEVRGIYTGASITFEAEVREIFTGASIIFETEVRGIYTGASITFEAEVREIFTGFDGGFAIEEVSGGFIAHADLSEEGLWLGRKWDWVMSIEVGEHISSNSEAFFLDNLARHACGGIVLTWAVEGQGGHHHVNNHNNDYIKQKMLDRGFVSDEKAEKRLKARLTGYLANTSMVFRRKNPTSCLND